jgi:hypothetical protein
MGIIGKALRDACEDLCRKKGAELGCNLGLLSIWAAGKELSARKRYESDILEGSGLVAEAFGFRPCSWHQADFNRKSDTERIGDDYALCTCLSVMNWVSDKNNLMNSYRGRKGSCMKATTVMKRRSAACSRRFYRHSESLR